MTDGTVEGGLELPLGGTGCMILTDAFLAHSFFRSVLFLVLTNKKVTARRLTVMLAEAKHATMRNEELVDTSRPILTEVMWRAGSVVLIRYLYSTG